VSSAAVLRVRLAQQPEQGVGEAGLRARRPNLLFPLVPQILFGGGEAREAAVGVVAGEAAGLGAEQRFRR
jgi:hypothetical protein